MLGNLKNSLSESFRTIMPIVLIVVVLSIFVPISPSLLISFIISSILLIIGSALFTFGADISMMIIGEKIGSKLVKSKKIWLVLLVSFIIGTVVTIAEPDLRVLAEQLISIPSNVLILTISVGVGISLLLSSLRSIYGWDLNKILLIGYTITLIFIFFVSEEFVPVAFDSGGITTGTISLPFIMTLGIGLTANRTDKKAKESSFGLVSLCSLGPIIMVLLLGLFYTPEGSYNITDLIRLNINFKDYLNAFSVYFEEVLFSILPIIIVFVIYQLLSKDVTKTEIRKIIFGLIVTILGLTMFFMAANVGFMDMGYFLGEYIGGTDYKYLLIPFGMVMAFYISIAEPAVQVLNSQVEDLTGGNISKKTLNIGLALGVSVATGLSLIRIFTNTSFLYYIIPGQILSLILMFFTPKIFTAIAFDAGGATGGTLTAAFLLPIAIGICLATGTNVLTGAFGLAALVSLAPLITIQVIGIMYNLKMKNEHIENYDEEIVDLDKEE